MRKLTFLLVVAAVAASSSGCVGRCRNWFHKGSPCGTMLSSPAMLSAPMAMSAPMTGPVMQPNICVEQQPMCVPCDPCMQYDPCATTGVTTGYFGGYLPGSANCDCDTSGATVIPPGATLVPAPTGTGSLPGPT